ncbi:hypothetical protein FM113_04900 [Leucobacter sp. 7(1)]|nr:hypothetical protein FM113_04900 [Leucobacter sp. 7(1)]
MGERYREAMNHVVNSPGPTPDSSVDPAPDLAESAANSAPLAEVEEFEEQEAELAADLEELWQEESPDTARRTEFAEQVDGDPDTREVLDEA